MLQDDFLSLFRGQGGRLGFTIDRDKFVSDVLDYAAINGLQPGCRIVQVCMSVCVCLFPLHSNGLHHTYRSYTVGDIGPGSTRSLLLSMAHPLSFGVHYSFTCRSLLYFCVKMFSYDLHE